MKKYIITGFLLVQILLMYSQKVFTEGYIIRNTGDTISCYVHPAALVDLQKKIIVVSDLTEMDKTEYKPFEVKEMNMERYGNYRSKIFEYRYVKDNIKFSTDYNAEEHGEFLKDTAFIRVLVDGKASLYSYTDLLYKTHYFIEKDSLFYELYEKMAFKTKANTSNPNVRVLAVQRKYLGILSFIFSDNPKISQKRLMNVKLKQSELIKIVKEYNSYF